MKVTVTGIKGIRLNEYSVGGEVVFKKDISSFASDNVIKAYINGFEVGVVASSTAMTIPGTKKAKDVYDDLPDNFVGTITDVKEIVSMVKVPVLVVELDGTKTASTKSKTTSSSEKQFSLKITGSKSKYPGKLKVIDDFKKGEIIYVVFELDEENVLCKYNGEPSGILSNFTNSDTSSKEEVELFKEILIQNAGKNVIEGKVISSQVASYIVSVSVSEKAIEESKISFSKKAISSVKEPLIKMGYDEETLNDIETYLLDNGFDVNDIKDIFNSYKQYNDEVKSLIPQKPERLFADKDKVMLYDSYSAIAEGLHIICSGEKGTGKNVFVETWAWILQRPLYSISINRETDKMDLLGSQIIEPQRVDENDDNSEYYSKVVFKKEVLIQAMENGGIINIDEINFADPGITGLLHSVGDDRRELFVPNYGLVKADKNFLMIATMNVGYQGTNELNEALSDRFVDIVFENNDSIREILELNCPFANKTYIGQADKLYKQIVQTVRDGDSSLDDSCVTVRGFIQALKMSKRIPLKRALIRCIADKVKDIEYRENLLQLIDTFVK